MADKPATLPVLHERLTTAISLGRWFVGIAGSVVVALVLWWIPREQGTESEKLRAESKNSMTQLRADLGDELSKQLQPMTRELAGLAASVELLKPNASKRIGALIRDKSTPTDSGRASLDIQTAATLAVQASDLRIFGDRSEVAEAGNSLVAASFKDEAMAPISWPAVLAVARYISFLNTKTEDVIKNVNQQAAALGLKTPIVGMTVRKKTNGETMTIEGLRSELNQSVRSSSFNFVPGKLAAIFAELSSKEAQTTQDGAGFFIVIGARVPLDGQKVRNIVFRDSAIIYGGGDLELINVAFENCTFEVPRVKNSDKFAKAIFSSAAVNVKIG